MNTKNNEFTYILAAGLLLIPHSKGDLYLDPGSGSFILQVLIAAGAGAVYMLRTQISNLFSFGRKKPAVKKPVAKKPAVKKSAAAKKSAPKKTSKARAKKRNAR